MKTPIKMLACAIAGSLVLLACNLGDELGNLQSGLNQDSIAFKVKYTTGNRASIGSSGITTVVSSKNEIEQYYGKNEIKIWDKQDYWHELDYNTIEKYSDNYFEDNFLVIVELWEPSGSIRHKVERIDENGDIVIRRLVPEFGTDDIGQWGIIIELNNNFKTEQFQAVFVNASSSSGKSSSSGISKTKIPLMDSRVVAYLRVGEEDGVKGFIDDIETLKSWFPPYTNVLYNEECNYFAVTFPIENDKSYMVLSEDMTLYSIQPDPTKGKLNPVTGKIGCDFYYPPIISYQSMLICDDKAGTIKENVNFNSAVEYVDLNWECGRESLVSKNVYFTHVSSSSSGEPVVATEMPIMDSRVVSYQRVGGPWVPAKTIVTDIDTLKLWFPNELDSDGQCNYFAIYNSTSSTASGRLVLSSDMVLYKLMTNGVCMETMDIVGEAMLVCDDESGTLKNNINLNGVYVVPDWICTY
jgi:hypothetical protein